MEPLPKRYRAMMSVAKAAAVAILAVALAAITVACGAAPGPSGSTASISGSSGSPTAMATAKATSTTAEASNVAGCAAATVVAQHQAQELEALLPARVGDRPLATWSVRGRCWLEMAYGGSPTDVDTLIAGVDETDPSQKINVTRLAMAVAGRSDTKADPPYFVFGVERGPTNEEIEFALFLLFGGAGYVDPTQGADLSAYQEETMSGKHVHVGNTSMLSQTQHIGGQPYLYQTDDYLFVVITDDRAWAEEALAQLP